MVENRPLWLPTEAGIANAYRSCTRWITPPVMLDFMATIGPIVGDPFMVRTIAVTIVNISSMNPPVRKIRHLDILLGDVNFPPEVSRAINSTLDRIVPPPDFVRLAERIITPMNNLTGALLEPPFPVPEGSTERVMTDRVSRLAHDEAITAFGNLRERFVRHVSYGLVMHTVAPDPMRGEIVTHAQEGIREHLAVMDMAAMMFGMILHHPDTWDETAADRLRVVTLLNEAKARDIAIQEYIDEGNTISQPRKVLAMVDDLLINHCERLVSSPDSDLSAFPFWVRVHGNSPYVET